jgi:hypothetical protein
MREVSTGSERGTGHYEFRVEGHLDGRWAAWFDGMTLTAEDDGTTRIHGPVLDQAALHGLLNKLRDVGLPLVSVTQVGSEQGPTPSCAPGESPTDPRSST